MQLFRTARCAICLNKVLFSKVQKSSVALQLLKFGMCNISIVPIKSFLTRKVQRIRTKTTSHNRARGEIPAGFKKKKKKKFARENTLEPFTEEEMPARPAIQELEDCDSNGRN